MSLSGSVEDLPLLEILQVVAFCQKTGYLTVKAPEGDAAVVFREGRVVSGYIWDVPPLAAGTSAPSADTQQEVVRQRINSTLARLVRLREGQFGFSVLAEAPGRVGGRDLTGETLEDGINPEGLMLDLARKLDEDRRESTASIEASFAAEAPSEVSPGEPPIEELDLEEVEAEDATPPTSSVLLVDDEPDVRRLVGDQLRAGGYQVVEAADARGGRLEVARLAEKGSPFLLVVDLGLPSLAGTNFRGGFEVVSHAAAFEPRPRILLMAEGADERLRGKARRLGVSILALKPGLAKLDPLQYEADLRVFGRKLARDLLPRLEKRRAPPPAPAKVAPCGSPADGAARAAALKGLLDELEGQPEPDLVAFLLLRAARAFLPRAILFLVKDDQLRGLAGFGPTDSGRSLDVQARDLSVSLDVPSPFADAVASGRPWAGGPPSDGPLRDLLACVGLEVSSAAVVPVRAQQETVAVLYGDDPGGGALPSLDSLVDFTRRAGRALDEAFLGQPTRAIPA